MMSSGTASTPSARRTPFSRSNADSKAWVMSNAGSTMWPYCAALAAASASVVA
ncbi:hypothetical protein LP419_32125 [Massilia sp. H-1]|nr:hypothetical protein LP419_32125 [Massilia sp. H-1]